MLTLYPEIRPYRVHRLAVDPPHELHVEESGNPAGIPVLFVHGGPGAGCQPSNRCFFDPARYRIVLFDQRGAGHSTPHGELAGNDTPALVRDIERIREFLGITRWVLFGGSWGSTLGLAYAEAFPERVSALILRGIFLCRAQDLRWFYQDGANRVFGTLARVCRARRRRRATRSGRRVSPSPDRFERDRAHVGRQGLGAVGGAMRDAASQP